MSIIENQRDDALKRCAAILAEHFDSVQIVATQSDMDGACMYHYGDGNWYARYGSVLEWIEKEEAKNRRVAELRIDSEQGEDEC